MKTHFVSLIAVATLMSGCMVGVRPYGRYGGGVVIEPLPPAVIVQAPAPAVIVTYAPESYVWDGYEYVGLYGDRYVYWGGGGWVFCDVGMIGRFHGWESYHPGWRGHATPYHRGRELHH